MYPYNILGWGAQEGNWMILMRSEPFTSPVGNGWSHSLFSLQLDSFLNNEKNYKLSFFIKDPPPPSDEVLCDDPLTNSIKIGISSSPTSFGTHIYSSPLGDSIWTQYSVIFNTQNAEEYLTIRIDTGNVNNKDVFIDNFVLVETTDSLTMGVNELIANNKQLLKIVDILGKESKPNKNGLLFYIYSDGTVEKKLIIE